MKEADLYHNNSEYVLINEYKKLEQQLKEARKHLTESVSREEYNKQQYLNKIEKVLHDLRWAKMTIKDKLTFGLDEESGIKIRERRCSGVLLTSIKELEGLIEEKE